MKGFEPQPEKSGNKSEKPEKAELDDETLEDVPESVLEAKDVELKEVENKEWPKEYEITVEIDGEQVEIPVKETKIEFTDYIVEDTGGVTGYIRKEIKWDELYDRYPLEDSDYLFKQVLEEYRNSGGSGPTPSKIIEKGGAGFERLIEKLINQITDDNFPNDTYNHLIGGSHRFHQDLRKQMKNEGLVLQKVLSPDTLLNPYEQGVDIKDLSGSMTLKINFNDLKYHEPLYTADLSYRSDISLEDMESIEKCQNDGSVYATGSRGLSVS